MIGALSALASIALATARPALPGDTLPAFSVRGLTGQVVEWKPGRPTVLSFFAFWCDTWKTHLPRVSNARSALASLPLDFLAVSLDGRWSELAPSDLDIPVALDPGGALRQKLGIDRIPATLAVDAKGVVRWAAYGTVRTEDIVRAAKSLIANPAPKSVTLTFDDFPSAQAELLLDELRRLQVQAALFVVCDRAEANAELLRRAVREGHSLQIHGWHHAAGPIDVSRCQQALQKAAGVQAGWLRAPGSDRTVPLTDGREAVPTATPYDHLALPKGELVRRVLLKAKAGGVVQLHDGNSATRGELEGLVRALRNAGFSLSPLP